MTAKTNPASERLAAAEAAFERDKHGKHAFIGSSAWCDYVHARWELEDARAAMQAASAAE